MSERKFVPKTWGFEDWVVNTPLYCLKRMLVARGRGCRWHYHKLKDETFMVVRGMLRLEYLTNEDIQTALNLGHAYADILTKAPFSGLWRVVHLGIGDSFHVPPLMPHRFQAMGSDCEFVEASTQHFDEDSYYPLEG